MLDDGRQRPDEVERAARHHEYAGDAAALVEDVLEWFQALLGARRVERGQGLVPARHHDRRQLLVAPALGLVGRRHQPCAERGDTRGRDDVDGRVQDDAGHLRCLGRDLRPEEQELGQHRRGRPARELLAHVRGERRRGADRQPIAHPREALRRLETGPVFDEVSAERALGAVWRPRPADVLGARRLHVGSQYRVGEHAQAVPALHQCARDAHQRRCRPRAVPGGHQQVGHLEPPPG